MQEEVKLLGSTGGDNGGSNFASNKVEEYDGSVGHQETDYPASTSGVGGCGIQTLQFLVGGNIRSSYSCFIMELIGLNCNTRKHWINQLLINKHLLMEDS